jgi:hypothetical protein
MCRFINESIKQQNENTHNRTNIHQTNVQLTRIQLRKFYCNSYNSRAFRDLFLSVVQSVNNLENVQKLPTFLVKTKEEIRNKRILRSQAEFKIESSKGL